MATIVDYQYIPEVSTLDALHNLASDTTNWYSQDLPWVNTFLINWANQITNIPEWWEWGIAGWSTNIKWSSSSYDSISWSSWYVYLPDWTQISVSSGSTSLSAVTYIYVDQQDWSVYATTSASSAVWDNKILLCVAWPTSSGKKCSYQAFWTNSQSTLITADNIAANTITGNEIQANSITSSEIHSWAITSSKIDSWAVTAGKIDVNQLSAISANLWSITAWDITWTTITAWSTGSWWVKLYPYSSNTWRIEFYYSWDMVGYIQWLSWWVWWAVAVSWDYFFLDTTVLCADKLRIPVWTNLYD